MSKDLVRVLVVVGCLTLIGTLSAGTATYTGTTAGGPTWNRPLAGSPPTPPPSGVGTNVPYNSQPFSVDLSGSYAFQSVATSPAGWDNYSFLYINSFNPLSQFTNVLIGNDDNPSIGLSGFTFNLTAGASYFFLLTGFSNTDFGAFTNTINGPGNIFLGGTAATPESGTGIVLFGIVIAGLLLGRSRLVRGAR